MALLWPGRNWATERPTFTGSVSIMRRSWNGWELAQHVNAAIAAIVDSFFKQCEEINL